MKNLIRITVLFALLALVGNAWAMEQKSDRSLYARPATKKNMTSSQTDRISYSIGMSLGQDFRMRDIEVNPEEVAQGLADAMAGNPTRLTREEAMAALQELQEMAMAKQQATLQAAAAENLAIGEAFLATNASRPGVVTLESGLQYEVLEAGNGRTPATDDVVLVDYVGSFIDGTEFDSSFSRGEPATLAVGSIIPGWTEALQLMQEGAKWKLYIPAELAYGEQGAPPVIQPNSTLIFEVTLKSIQ
jgi:FKBP-type peptidyl-prolyl cis-trans isomerase FklB